MKFVKAPVAILRLSTISDSARLLWCILMSYANLDGTNCFPSAETLAKDMGKKRRAVFGYIAELETAGLLKRSAGRKAGSFASNSYTIFTAPPCVEKQHSPRAQKGHTTKNHVPREWKWDGLGGQQYDGRRTLMHPPDA